MSKKQTEEAGKPKGHIMVVDDDGYVLDYLNRALAKANYEVTLCSDGFKAVEFYEENFAKVDLVLLDMIMPDMDGWVTFRELKKINPDVLALIASAYAVDSVIEECLRDGALGLLRKPYELKDLLAAIQKHVK